MSLANLSIRRPVFITCIVSVILVIGGVCLKTLPVDLYPDVTFPVVFVQTTYTGTAPEEMETLVTKPLEEEMTTISGVKRLTSKSLEGISQVTMEFESGVDIKYAEQQVRDKVANAKSRLPEDADDPIIRRIDPSDLPIVTISVNAELGEAELYDLADQGIKPRLEQVKDVGLVEIVGGRKREIRVELDREKLKAREFGVDQVSKRIESAGENIPGGKVSEGDKETLYRSLGQFASVDDVANTVISLYGNEVPTRVKDLGTVVETLEDEKSRVYVDGKKSLFIQVFRQSGSNTVAVADGTHKLVQKLEGELKNHTGKPQLLVIRDASREIRDNILDVRETITIGIVLTILIVYLFLANWRSTIITGLALPNSLIGAFILLAIAGFSINVVTLMSLSLAVGLLIDDAIVVRENIFRHLEMGEEPVAAAEKGTAEVQMAVIATTLVVIAVFAPVAFMKGIIGQFLKSFGLTVCFAMAISLFDALTVGPMLSAYFAGIHKEDKKKVSIWKATVGRLLALFDRFQVWLERNYGRLLEKGVLRHPILTLVAAVLVFLSSFLALGKVPFTFFPDAGWPELAVDLDMPPGTNIEGMARVALEADQVIRSNKEIERSALTVGNRNNEANKASFYVRLVPSKDRTRSSAQMKEMIRKQLVPFAFANPRVGDYDATGSGQSVPFLLRIIGQDSKVLEDYSTQLLAELKKNPGLKDVDTSYRPGKPEFQFQLDNEKARIYGINTKTLGDEIRAEVEGDLPAKYRIRGNEYEVRVRLKEDQRNLKENFDRVLVPNVNGRLIRLADIATAHEKVGPTAIDRQDRGRYIQISAALAPGAGLGNVMADGQKLVAEKMPLPAGLRYAYVGDAENFAEMANSMLVALFFAVAFIYFVLASLYESFITPFTIMLALPLALCGAFFALFITGQSLNLFALLGIIMLLGVASKNSILLVDLAHRLMDEGKDRATALAEAGRTRLRPILMTSMALIAGTLPVAIGLNEASKMRSSMGIAIIGGLITSTLLSLVVIPAAFLYIDRFRVSVGELFRKVTGAADLSVSPGADNISSDKIPNNKADKENHHEH